MHPRILFALLAMFAVALMAACSEPSSRYEAATQEVAQTPIYPHAANYGAATQHGRDVIADGADNCRGCHGEDLAGGWTKTPCNACHRVYPHDEGFAVPDRHAAVVGERGLGACASICHGDDLRGGDAGVSCFTCHANYPHDSGWADIERHGVFVVENGGPETCATFCHGAQGGGGFSGVACNSCHEVYPHRWDDLTDHAGAVGEGGLASCQTACHGEDLEGGLSGISCFDCHS